MEPPSPARQRLAILAAAVPSLLLSAKLFHVLFEPLAGANRQWVVDAVLLMVLEFIMLNGCFELARHFVKAGPPSHEQRMP